MPKTITINDGTRGQAIDAPFVLNKKPFTLDTVGAGTIGGKEQIVTDREQSDIESNAQEIAEFLVGSGPNLGDRTFGINKRGQLFWERGGFSTIFLRSSQAGTWQIISGGQWLRTGKTNIANNQVIGFVRANGGEFGFEFIFANDDETFSIRKSNPFENLMQFTRTGNRVKVVTKLHVPIVATASLPAAAAAENGSILIEDGGVGDRNIIIYAGGERFRIDGGANV